MCRYSKPALYQCKRGSGHPPSDVIVLLKSLGLFRNRSRKQGRQVEKTIPVITSKKKARKPPEKRPYKHLEVPRIWFNLPSLLLSNVNSLCNKIDEVVVTAKDINPDVMAITEAWQIVPQICQIQKYRLFHHLRTDRRGGGVVLYCREELNPFHLNMEVPDGVECLWVRVSPGCHPRHASSIIYGVVYHPPRSPTGPVLIEHLINTADSLRVRYPSTKLVICGDFNELDTTDLQAQLNLEQLVDFPTHGQNTLDLIMTDLGQHYLPPEPRPPMGRSDHTSVFWSPAPTTSQHRNPVIKTYRPTPDSAIRQFGQWVTGYPWTEVITIEDLYTKWENYVNTINAAYQHFFPVKTLRTHPSDVPWITPRIKRLMKQRNQAFYTDNATYRRLRNKVIREIKAAKLNYYPSKLHHLKQSNSKQWYTKIKDICGIGTSSDFFPCVSHLSQDEAAEQINDHFSAISQSLPKLDLTLLPAYLPSPSPPPLIHEYEVAKKLLSFKSKRSTTPVDLPINIYQEFAYELATPLCSIVNASLRQSKCPADWKTAFTTPIPKLSNPPALNDLRPISLTPIPSLICEDFVFNWAYSDINALFDIQQFGNIKNTSTTHCLVSLLDFIYRNLDKRKTSLAVSFIDFRKAFDLVDHTIVIKKAIKMGLHPSLVSWLADFLTNRRQAVRYQGSTSSFKHLTCGVPQGTKMGPLCFLILINDALTDTPSHWKYVDDSTVAVTINNSDPDYGPLQNTLDNITTWTTQNNVTINHTKTVVMHINTSTTAVPPPEVTIGPHPLQVVESTKLLGVIIDAKLDWKQHVNKTVQGATFQLYMLRRLKSLGTPQQELGNIYKLYILPKLTYASPSWSSSLTTTQQRQLERVQKRACKIILGSSYNTYEEALASLNLTTLTTRHLQDLQKFGSGLLQHPRLRHLLPLDVQRPDRTTRHHNRIQPIRARTDRYKKSPIPSIVSFINNL